MLYRPGKASYLCSPKLIRERLLQMPLLGGRKLEKVNNNFGRIRKVYIFACPNKKGAKKIVLRVGKRVRPRGSVRFVTLSLTILCNKREVL
jgi:hypothetical protein